MPGARTSTALRTAAIGASVAGLLLGATTTAHSSGTGAAATSYESKNCGSRYECVFLFHNSITPGIPLSACFVAGRNTPDHWGRTESGGTHPVRYVFRKHQGSYCDSSGDGQELRKNAAAVSNRTSSNHRIYTGYSYTGTSQRIKPKREEFPVNLNRALKNKNQSSRKAN